MHLFYVFIFIHVCYVFLFHLLFSASTDSKHISGSWVLDNFCSFIISLFNCNSNALLYSRIALLW